MHLTRVENSDTKMVSLFWHTRYVKEVSVLLVYEEARLDSMKVRRQKRKEATQ